MALHYQPQRYRNTLHHYLTISLRRCRSPRDNNEDATLSPRQYHTHRKCLQSIRDRSRTFDDFLGSVSISFWFCKLHHSLTNWLPGPGLSWAQIEVHVCVSVGYSRNHLHDALCIPFISSRRCSPLRRQSFWHGLFLINPGRRPALGQCVLVLWAS